jgi:hypothetical protein
VKKLFFLLTLTVAINAHALTFNDLIERYGKRSVMNAIADKIDHEFTVMMGGSMQLRHAPNPDYVTEGTLVHDSTRAGLSPKEVELAILEKIKNDNEEKRSNAENEEHLRQWEIEQAKEVERLKADAEKRIRQQQMMGQIREQIRQAYPNSYIEPEPVKITSSKSTSSTSYDNSNYFSLPDRIRWANDNPSGTACHAAVAQVRKLDNDPSFDSDTNTRKRWSNAVEYAAMLGCKL